MVKLKAIAVNRNKLDSDYRTCFKKRRKHQNFFPCHVSKAVFQKFVGIQAFLLRKNRMGNKHFFPLFTQCLPQIQSVVPPIEPNLSINPFPNKPWFLRVCSTSL